LVSTAIGLAAAASLACGKKGPPLPPLVRVPSAPATFLAERRGDQVDITVALPSSNVDGTRPANVQRVEVYAYTAASPVSAGEIVRQGTIVGTIPVKRPRDPNRVIEPDEAEQDMEPLLDTGADQGATVHVIETVSEEVLKAASVPSIPSVVLAEPSDETEPPSNLAPARRYVAVPINTRGQAGPASQVAGVPLVAAPATPARPNVTYDEKAVTVAPAPTLADVLQALAPDSASKPPSYHVYQMIDTTETRLTKTPVTSASFADERIEWGAERCYAVRLVETAAGLTVESEPSPSACVKLTDTFPPSAPTGLLAVPSEGSISLIWDENGERDLAGYIVMRGSAASSLRPVTPGPITVTRFTDTVPAGSRFVYAVQAIDTAGNASQPSGAAEETAR
jgi:hypothetical protein